jgi:hypothetical protein
VRRKTQTPWIETTTGYVNLATARSARKARDDRWVVTDGGGNEHVLNHVFPAHHFTEDAQDVIIPAAGSQTLIAINFDEDAPPGREFLTEIYPIIGWQVSGDYTAPIIPGMRAGAHGRYWICLIPMPDGLFLEAVHEGAKFETIEAAKQQREEDRGRGSTDVNTAVIELQL